MFNIEYRTIARLSAVAYGSKILCVGAHKVQSREQAEAYAKSVLGNNVEIIDVQYVGSL